MVYTLMVEITFYAADLGLDLNLDGTYEYGVVLTHGTGGDQDYSAALYKDGTWKSSYDVLEGNTINDLSYGEFYPDDDNRKAWVKMDSGTKKGDVTINISSSPSGLWEWTLTIDKNLLTQVTWIIKWVFFGLLVPVPMMWLRVWFPFLQPFSSLALVYWVLAYLAEGKREILNQANLYIKGKGPLGALPCLFSISN
ncbi:MAG: hypothetical protein KCCBMMGE_00710 [Candidatus Methanoperedenaceae archaeon GB37]|nr:MAG: hypothetical protein KCCBMMGE_00710 [Candidatus Methanoperedenaceae archaeon GB37]